MAVHMPRNAADIQAAAPATTPHHANLVDFSDDSKEALGRLKREEIFLIVKRGKIEGGGYLVYSLVEPSAEASGDKASRDDNADRPPFELSVVLLTVKPPDELLAEFLVDQVPAHLRSDNRNHIVEVVVSTRSGTRQAPAFFRDVLRPFLKALGLYQYRPDDAGRRRRSARLYPYRAAVTKSSTTIRDFARGLATAAQPGQEPGQEPEPSRTIILLSGDGGVVDLLNGLDRSTNGSFKPPTVAVLPLGTGNALFHSLHKPLYAVTGLGPSPLVLGLRTLLRGIAAPLPTFKATFSPGSRLVSSSEPSPVATTNGDGAEDEQQQGLEIDHLIGAIVASYGFHASLVWESDTPAYRVHGDKRFGMAAAELLKLSHAYDARVEIRTPPGSRSGGGGSSGGGEFVALRETGKEEERFSYVLATMVSNLEKTFTISPASRPLDGRIRLVHFGDVGGQRTMEIMMAAYRGGEHVGMRWARTGTGTGTGTGESGGAGAGTGACTGECEGSEAQDTSSGQEEDGVGYDEVEEVRVTIREEDARWRKVCIDGTIVEVEKGGWMAVRRAEDMRLKVLVDASVLREDR